MKAGHADQETPGTVAQYYWVGLVLLFTGLGLLAVLACWLRRCRNDAKSSPSKHPKRV